MAAATTTISIPVVAVVSTGKSPWRIPRVNYISGLNSFGGLKAHNNVDLLGAPVSTEQAFARIVCSLREVAKGQRGGSLSSTCNTTEEIFRVAAIMPALVLIGVAVGFVLLRLEATLEEE